MLDAIAKPFGILMMWLYELTGNYMMAVILFSLAVKLILLPFQMKSKKGMMRQTLLQPQMAEIQKKHGANQQKYSEELQKLYKEEGVNPMSGCLWSLLPFPILIALYGAIRSPLTVMMGVASDALAEGGVLLEKLTELGFESSSSAYIEIAQAQFISNNWDKFEGLVDNLKNVNFVSFGLDLGATPSWKLWTWDWSSVSSWLPQLGLFLIPIIAAVLTWVPSKLSPILNNMTLKAAGMEPQQQDPTAQTANTMMIIMPLMTVFFCFAMPSALGIYWIANSVFGIIQDVLLSKWYTKTVAAGAAEKIAARRKREEELEAKRQATEKLKAENATSASASTSKRKQQNKKKQLQNEKSAAWLKAHSDEDENKYEPSRVGNRQYARGRSYDPDRYSYNGIVGATSNVSELDDELSAPDTQENKADEATGESTEKLIPVNKGQQDPE